MLAATSVLFVLVLLLLFIDQWAEPAAMDLSFAVRPGSSCFTVTLKGDNRYASRQERKARQIIERRAGKI